MALTNAEVQRRYRQRAKRGGLVRLQTLVKRDTDDMIDILTTKFQKPRYAVVEYAIRRLMQACNDGKPI